MIEIEPAFLNQDFKLLAEFRRQAAGSFRHSCSVSTIFESVASELSLDVSVAKAAGLYHDIGKIHAPQLFGENQPVDTNIHDTMDPKISYYLITKHVSDGVLILIQNGFPIKLIEIVSQHHGNSILRPFLSKGIESSKTPVLEDEYRYTSSKPSTIEACILMMIDSCEAAVQSVIQHNKNKTEITDVITKTVDNVCERLICDGQVDNLKIGMYNSTKKIILSELKSYHHKRVSYDDSDKTIGQMKEENGGPKNGGI